MTVLDGRQDAPGLAAVPALPPSAGARGFPLRRLLEGDTRGCFDVVAAPGGLDALVERVRIWDPERAPAAGELVLVPVPGIGAMELAEVLAAAARAGAAAVVIRIPPLGVTASAVRAAAVRAGVPLLAVTGAMSWDEVSTVARALVPAVRVRATTGAAALFELADSAAAVLDRVVLIGDGHLRLLAHAVLDGSLDEPMIQAILGRRLPTAVRAARTVRCIPRPTGGPVLAAPVIACEAVVGFVCAGGAEPFTEADVRVVGDVAAAAAAHFLTPPVDDEDALRADLLRSLLAGNGSLEVLTDRIDGPAPRTWSLVGLAGEGLGPAVEAVVARASRMLAPGATAAVVDGDVAVLVPHAAEPALVDLAARLRARCAALTSGGIRACVGDPVTAQEDLPAALRAVRRGLTVLANRSGPAVATLAELRPHTVIADLAGLADQHDTLRQGPLDILLDDASPRGPELLHTVAAWFDAGCDLTRAATRLQVHRNTLRYRLRRIEQLCNVDLENPVERFTCELQIRLLGLRR